MTHCSGALSANNLHQMTGTGRTRLFTDTGNRYFIECAFKVSSPAFLFYVSKDVTAAFAINGRRINAQSGQLAEH